MASGKRPRELDDPLFVAILGENLPQFRAVMARAPDLAFREPDA